MTGRLSPLLRLTLLAALFAVLFPARIATSQTVNEYTFGVLYYQDPLAPASTRAAAAEFGASIINTYLGANGSIARVKLVMAETGNDPARATAAVLSLYAQGVRFFIGPETSGELDAIERLPIAADIAFISHASTAPSLASRTSPVVRLAPNDTFQAEAMTSLMLDEGIRAVVPIWRGDVYGRDLTAEVRVRMTAAGRQVFPGSAFSPGGEDLSSVVPTIAAQVRQAISLYGARAVAVYVVAFEQTVAIEKLAANTAPLGDVSWYGSDGAALDRNIAADPQVSVFAWQTGFIAPIYGEYLDTDQTEVVADAIRQATNMAPEPYALTMYDAVVLAGLAIEGTTCTVSAQAFIACVRREAADYYGVTGEMLLDENGDRVAGGYDFWSVQPRADGVFWIKSATYTFELGQLGVLEHTGSQRRNTTPGVGIPGISVRP